MAKGKTGNRQRNTEINKRLILDAAKAVIVSEGVEKMTVRNLAKDAGLDTRTIYNLFGSKEAVISALLRDEAAVFVPALMEGLGKDELLSFHNLVDAVYSSAKDDERLFQALIRTAMAQGNLEAAMQILPQMVPMFERMIANGELADGSDASILAYLHFYDVMSKTGVWARGEISMKQLVLFAKYDYCLLLYKFATKETRQTLEPLMTNIESEIHKTI